MSTTEIQVDVPVRTAADLYSTLVAGQPFFILDVRNNEDFARWRVEGRASLEVLNVPYFDFIEDEDAAAARVPTDREVLVVCAKEGSSRYVAEILRNRGVDAAYLQDGIISWGDFYDIRDIVSTSAGRIVQVTRPARGDVSFVAISDGAAALIDPLRHTGYYEQVVTEAGARITHIFDTHAHADHISGGPALARSSGAPYFLHPYDAIHPIDMLPARFDYTPLADGQRYQVGQFNIEVIWFPGHTLGQVNFLLTTPEGASYLFSGDGLFLSSFGRPDLGGKGETWTPVLYTSMYERLPARINDATYILPAHFSHLDEDDGHGRFSATYAEVRERNAALAPATPEAFQDFVLAHLPVFPPQYVEIKRVNIGLVTPSEAEANELELGKNVCALSA